jgi:Na+/melibiose symporter-like transporter
MHNHIGKIHLIKNFFKNKPVISVLWVIVLAAIPLFSRFGRVLQGYLADTIGRTGTGWLLGSGVFVLLVCVTVLLVRRSGRRALIHLAWMLILIAGLMLYLRDNPERWYHIILFGPLGFLSVQAFSIRTGAEIALSVAFLDELFQFFLPNRVGDFVDVMINAVCAGTGIIFYIIIRKKLDG